MNQKQNAVVRSYLNNISEFYRQIVRWLKEKSFYAAEEKIQIYEEASGKYTASSLMIRDSKNVQIAEIRPVGAWIIGGDGRLDVIGKFDKQILVYLYKNKSESRSSGETAPTDEKSAAICSNVYPFYKGIEKDGWYWIKDARIGRAYIISRELFFDLLAEVSDYESKCAA